MAFTTRDPMCSAEAAVDAASEAEATGETVEGSAEETSSSQSSHIAANSSSTLRDSVGVFGPPGVGAAPAPATRGSGTGPRLKWKVQT